MYAITQATLVVGGPVSGDQFFDNWWTGRVWSPTKDRAKTFKTRDEALAEMEEKCVRFYRLTEIVGKCIPLCRVVEID